MSVARFRSPTRPTDERLRLETGSAVVMVTSSESYAFGMSPADTSAGGHPTQIWEFFQPLSRRTASGSLEQPATLASHSGRHVPGHATPVAQSANSSPEP